MKKSLRICPVLGPLSYFDPNKSSIKEIHWFLFIVYQKYENAYVDFLLEEGGDKKNFVSFIRPWDLDCLKFDMEDEFVFYTKFCYIKVQSFWCGLGSI